MFKHNIKEFTLTLHSSGSASNFDPSCDNDPFCSQPVPLLEPLDTLIFNSDISIEDLYKAVKSMKNGKTPGCDSIPVEF